MLYATKNVAYGIYERTSIAIVPQPVLRRIPYKQVTILVYGLAVRNGAGDDSLPSRGLPEYHPDPELGKRRKAQRRARRILK